MVREAVLCHREDALLLVDLEQLAGRGSAVLLRQRDLWLFPRVGHHVAIANRALCPAGTRRASAKVARTIKPLEALAVAVAFADVLTLAHVPARDVLDVPEQNLSTESIPTAGGVKMGHICCWTAFEGILYEKS